MQLKLALNMLFDFLMLQQWLSEIIINSIPPQSIWYVLYDRKTNFQDSLPGNAYISIALRAGGFVGWNYISVPLTKMLF